MKKKNVILTIIGIVLVGGLFTFASFYNYKDNYLRVDGIRVRVPENALTVEGSNSDSATAIYCKEELDVNGSTAALEFKFVNFKENGYPKELVATINGKEFYHKNNLNIEENNYYDYQIFANFHVIDKYIMFTIMDGAMGRNTTLYAIDTNGNIILEEKDIDKDDMKIKDYEEFITYKDNTATVYATRVSDGKVYKNEDICKASAKDIVEAYYTYTYKNNKFTKKATKNITAAEYIKANNISC